MFLNSIQTPWTNEPKACVVPSIQLIYSINGVLMCVCLLPETLCPGIPEMLKNIFMIVFKRINSSKVPLCNIVSIQHKLWPWHEFQPMQVCWKHLLVSPVPSVAGPLQPTVFQTADVMCGKCTLALDKPTAPTVESPSQGMRRANMLLFAEQPLLFSWNKWICVV